MEDFLDRIERAMERWRGNAAKTVALFTHAGVIRFAICHILGMDPRHHVAFEIPYASVVMIKLFKRKGVLEAVIPVTAMGL
jgi:broad specificity phosphatase PhoE